ncbi:cyclin-A2-like [Dromiciops gliroides]|uniref:cyclin-A2-like n=1 Tax=Dromiciops gliroides TaxID=33562 RepID=UPI001CC3D831|nr:cyclin-A2-like [Dromiciops gliroides]
MLGRTWANAVEPQLPWLSRIAGPDDKENIQPDECGGRAERTIREKLDLVQTPSPSPSPRCALDLALQKPQSLGGVAPLSDSPVHDEQDIGPSRNPTREQAAFTIHGNDPGRENGKQLPVPKKVEPEDDVLDFLSAVSPDYPGDGRFESPLPMDTSAVLEPEEKPPSVVDEALDYHEDIYVYLRGMEVRCKPKAGYMKKQPHITNSMRAALVDWLVVLGQELDLQNETLHLTVNYTDRFLSSMSVLPEKLQLVGTAAMLLASKFEEVYTPTMLEFLYLADYMYTKTQLLKMEQIMLKVLAFNLGAPTTHQFLTQYFLHQQPASSQVESLAMFLGELTLIDADPYLKYLPSIIAGAAFHIALYTITGQSWPESLIQKTGYTLESLKPCLMDLHQTYLRAPQSALQSVLEKYKMQKYHRVALLKPPETLNLE